MKKLLITLIILSSHTALTCDSAFECFQEAQEINKFLRPIDSCLGELEKSELESNTFNQPTDKTESDLDVEKKLVFDKDSWKYVLAGVAMAPPAFILGTAIHEGGHCLAAEAYNFKCFDVRVIPFRDEETGYFYFGRMSYTWEDGQEPPTPNQQAIIGATPMITNASLISVYSALAFSDNLPKNKWAKTVTFVLGATQVVDLANHLRNTHPYSDSGKLMRHFREEKGMSDTSAFWTVKGPQLAFTLIGTTALAVEGVRLFTEKKPNKNFPKLKIAPEIHQNGGLLVISGEF